MEWGGGWLGWGLGWVWLGVWWGWGWGGDELSYLHWGIIRYFHTMWYRIGIESQSAELEVLWEVIVRGGRPSSIENNENTSGWNRNGFDFNYKCLWLNNTDILLTVITLYSHLKLQWKQTERWTRQWKYMHHNACTRFIALHSAVCILLWLYNLSWFKWCIHSHISGFLYWNLGILMIAHGPVK